MKLRPLHCIFASCSDAADDAPAKARWFQTTPPYGEYPGGESVRDEDGRPIEGAVVVFDERSADRVVAAFEAAKAAGGAAWPGVLVDQEHFSLDRDKPSTALAWAKEIRRAADGSLWTRWEFTEEGLRLHEGRMLVSRSPVLRLERRSERRFAPAELQSIGMTNTPHFKELSPLAAARESNNPKGDTNMDPEILAALGLRPEAGKEEALAAIRQLKDKEAAAIARCDEAEKKAASAESEKEKAVAECRATKADAFIAANAGKIADAAKFREIYLANPELAERTLAVCRGGAGAKPGAPTTVRLAARDAKTPASAPGGATDAKIVARNRAVAEYRAANRCSFATAWAACRMADPELFAD